MTTKTVDIHEAQTHLTELLSSVTAGTEIILTEDNTPIARLVRIASNIPSRVAGLHVGVAWTSVDFDEPLPDDFWVEGA